jgi:hypothetical protein
MDRRTFLIRAGAGLVAVPAVLTLKACGDDGGPTDDSGVPDSSTDDASDDGTVPETSFTANGTGSGHVHSITVECADLGEDGITYTSTTASSHSHQVTLTAEELTMIAGGDAVVVITTDAGHEHTWTIQKPETACA